ncbi:S-DNA-T family DNA segregation ATPase FtsK/SpoIIIE [Anaerosolibacter carboniphilus]|uniref:S-DNA-T family DNA segregation ATPase FtsK/SpoIIIE n=1 Tax=Anaerosolibacter carboniphilus TaxID=1417629 RepID=A0A841KS18_9FIRM|nr:DNA translocase FtsK [Anaerosolibacter carboniphilus]MBB6216534.1 S-DNA-T family DNA segregation ATPase FtsK/SpoIIIE [Anaerosolibacter carboniphilus]
MSRKQRKKEQNKSPIPHEIFSLFIISIGILVLISLQTESSGEIGKIIKYTLKGLLAQPANLLPFVIIAFGLFTMAGKLKSFDRKLRFTVLVLYLSYVILYGVNHVDPTIKDQLSFSNLGNAYVQGIEDRGSGFIGTILGLTFLKLFGLSGSYVIVITIMMASLLMLTNVSLVTVLGNIKKGVVAFFVTLGQAILEFIQIHPEKEKKSSGNKEKAIIEKQKEVFINDHEELPIAKNETMDAKIKILDFTRRTEPEEREVEGQQIPMTTIEKVAQKPSEELNEESIDLHIHQAAKAPIAYKMPSLNLLENGNSSNNKNDKKEILNKAKVLEDTLQNFGVDAKVMQVSKGPTITRYEIQPSPGVKVSKIVSLSDDIALNLAASHIRIEAPIPGKAAVGIEIPNDSVTTVTVKEVLVSEPFSENESKLTFVLGKDIAGNPMVSDLAKMPHLLIAGSTGSGKSVCVNTLITSILYKALPDEVKFLLIDPKVVELNNYNGIPHLLIPVVTDPKKASTALNWAVQEMTNRYKSFAQNGVRDITGYNEKMMKEGREKLSKIVIIIDELADLMMVAPGQVEDAICRLAQMARAAGMHLIVATQRPSVDVITGVIKANIPSRIAFAVSSQADSRTILDMGGAEKLLGKGDMLFYPVGASKPKRIQGAFISDAEVERVVSFVKEQAVEENNYELDIIEKIENDDPGEEDVADELLKDAIELVVQTEQASISMLQRRFRIGYNRAARLIDAMEERGIVGQHEGSKPRQVLVSKEEFEDIKSRS